MNTFEATQPPSPADLMLAVSALPAPWVIRYNVLRKKLDVVHAARATLREYDECEREDLSSTVIVCGGVS